MTMTQYLLAPLIISLLSLASVSLASHEALEWSYGPSRMPVARSDITTTLTIAPDDNGDLKIGIYIIGGCDNPSGYIYSETSGELYCPSITSENTVYDPVLGLFSRRSNAPRARFRHAASTIDGVIWLIGGRDVNDDLIEEVDVYFAARDEWKTVGKLPPGYATSDLAIFKRGELIYVSGGYDSDYNAVSTTFALDTEQVLINLATVSTIVPITRLADMDTPRGDINALIFGRYAYVVGGFTHLNGFCEPLRSVEVYNTVANHWIYANDLKIGRADVPLIRYNAKFYALGGETTPLTTDCTSLGKNKFTTRTFPVNSVEVYDPSLGIDSEWSIMKKGSLPDDKRFRFAAASWPEQERIYVFGGVMNNDTESLDLSDFVIVYDDLEELDLSDYMDLIWFGFGVSMLITFLYVFIWIKERTLTDNTERAQGRGDGVHDDYEERASFTIQLT